MDVDVCAQCVLWDGFGEVLFVPPMKHPCQRRRVCIVSYLLFLCFPSFSVQLHFTVQNLKDAFKLMEHDILTISSHHDSSQFTFLQTVVLRKHTISWFSSG